MLINGKEFTVDDLVNEINFNNMQENNNLGLTAHQISVLKSFNINYEVGSLKELIYLVNEVFNDNDDEALEVILEELSERDYYENTRK